MAVYKIELLHAAAYLFSRDNTRSFESIATELGMNPRSLYRWAKTLEWREALTQFGYPADAPMTPPKSTEPKRSVEKDTDPELENRAFQVYISARVSGKNTKRAVTEVATQLGRDRRVINRMRDAFNWESRYQENPQKWEFQEAKKELEDDSNSQN